MWYYFYPLCQLAMLSLKVTSFEKRKQVLNLDTSDIYSQEIKYDRGDDHD